MDMQTLDRFEGLILLARKLDGGNSHASTFENLSVEQTCFSVYDIDQVEEAFLAAANRIADRFRLVLFRLDIEDGVPSFLVSFGIDIDDARVRLTKFVEQIANANHSEPPAERH